MREGRTSNVEWDNVYTRFFPPSLVLPCDTMLTVDKRLLDSIVSRVAKEEQSRIYFPIFVRHHWVAGIFRPLKGEEGRKVNLHLYDSAPSHYVRQDIVRQFGKYQFIRFIWGKWPRQRRGSEDCGLYMTTAFITDYLRLPHDAISETRIQMTMPALRRYFDEYLQGKREGVERDQLIQELKQILLPCLGTDSNDKNVLTCEKSEKAFETRADVAEKIQVGQSMPEAWTLQGGARRAITVTERRGPSEHQRPNGRSQNGAPYTSIPRVAVGPDDNRVRPIHDHILSVLQKMEEHRFWFVRNKCTYTLVAEGLAAAVVGAKRGFKHGNVGRLRSRNERKGEEYDLWTYLEEGSNQTRGVFSFCEVRPGQLRTTSPRSISSDGGHTTSWWCGDRGPESPVRLDVAETRPASTQLRPPPSPYLRR
ncbi:hypothetical protein STCU_12177 [Strigomonas culicis]|uniref:Uncharacterized protein n=1 Tax=Strigomonas culicis TaxID=28005 RepID=S9TFZ6_9TRYP|nr:hypothetical protein STCU_12177 [Strigomonas culicis]|eukprot:EPY15268.1 hypothetical protein STCU_12177 [Strigomonas culicis]